MGGVARALPGCLMWATAAAVAAATETPPPLAQTRAGMPQSPVIAVAPLGDVPTEAIHELGHAYGLGHCGDPHCVMWFSNTVAESDRKGMRLCRTHARELARAQRR